VACGTHFVEVRGVVSSSILSICSRERPLVSGTRKYAKEKEMQHSEPHRKKTLGPRLASPESVPTR
jgi:hypothetical protein